ncbi:MAG: vitamin K epoxide reductase family protein [Candidatus Manganitrophaceae bacterium]|nr:MAG: vitamin K epoxide reductase family protein [Candidatus Manganitrophaceae bacterium]
MPPKKIILALLLAASLIGFVDAAYLTAKHFLGVPPPCGRFGGCETVTTSEYATIGGAPLALLGALYYLAVFLSVIAYLDTRRPGILRMTAGFTAVGFIASLWFVYLQLFVIKAICPYCMLSAFVSTVLFIVGIAVLRGQGADASPANARSR